MFPPDVSEFIFERLRDMVKVIAEAYHVFYYALNGNYRRIAAASRSNPSPAMPRAPSERSGDDAEQ
jgi:hypothetical protein